MKNIFRFLFLLLSVSCFTQDIHRPVTTPNTALLSHVPWANVNGKFIFVPIYPASSIFVYVRNYSSATKSGVTLTLFSTPDPNVADLTNNPGAWSAVAVSGSTCPSTFTTLTVTSCFATSIFAAQVAIVISGATASGTTDFADLFVSLSPIPPSSSGAITQVIGPTQNGLGGTISPANNQPVLVGGYFNNNTTRVEGVAVDSNSGGMGIGHINGSQDMTGQAYGPSANALDSSLATQSGYFTEASNTVQAMRGSRRIGLAVAHPLAYYSDSLSTAFITHHDAVNPVATADLLEVASNSTIHKLYFHTANISCSTTCDVTVNLISILGTGCTTNAQTNLSIAGTLFTSSVFACATPPTVQGVMYHLYLPTGGIQVVALDGVDSFQSNVGWGIQFVEGAAVPAGTVSISTDYWYAN